MKQLTEEQKVQAREDALKAAVLAAVQVMWKVADLPPKAMPSTPMEIFEAPYKVRSPGVNIDVAEGFTSLFKQLRITFCRHKRPDGEISVELNWSYRHPGGGSNGYSIGNVITESANGRVGWRLSNSRDEMFGYVGINRFFSEAGL